MASTILFQMIMLFTFVAIGWLLTKSGQIVNSGPLGGFVTGASLPAMIIVALQAPLSASLLADIGITMLGFTISLAAGSLVGLIIGRLCSRGSSGFLGVSVAAVAFPNSIFMGGPVMVAIYGEQVLPMLAGIIFIFNLSSFTFGAWVLGFGSKSADGVSFKKLFGQPAVIACFVGAVLMFMPFRLPMVIITPLEMLAGTATPIATVIIGCQLAKIRLSQAFLDARVYVIALTRLIPAGLAAHFLMRLFITDPVILGFLTISACMPVAATVPMIAAQQGGDGVLASRVTFVSTLISVVSAPIVLPLVL